MMPADANPFAAQRIDRLAFRAPGVTIEGLLARLHAMGARGALVGPCGSGKTTLLEAIAGRLRACGYHVVLFALHADERHLPHVEVRGRWLLVDGADLLPWPRRYRLFHRARHAAGMVITARCEGLLPTLHRCTTSEALLRALVAELGVDDPPLPLGELYRACGGNLRDALRALYDACAGRGRFASLCAPPDPGHLYNFLNPGGYCALLKSNGH